MLQKRPFDYVNRGTCKKILLTSEGGGDGHICIEACWWVPENVKSFKKMVPGNVKSFKKWVPGNVKRSDFLPHFTNS